MSTEDQHEAEAEELRRALVEAGKLDAKAFSLAQRLVVIIVQKNARIEQLEATLRLLRVNRS